MNKTSQDHQAIHFRIFEWPMSLLIGGLIGLVIALGIVFGHPRLHNLFEPTGIYLFLGGWVIILAGGFGVGINHIIDIPSPTKRQRLIRRYLIATGIILNVLACTFYTTI
jgi:hypothetical protein